MLQYAVKFGQGFHSNDTRVSVLRESDALPKSTGGDIEVSWKVSDNMVLTSAVWFLNLDQEFVYVGDEGIVEPSGQSQRKGVDFSARLELKKGLLANADFNYTYARSTNGESLRERIPLAPHLTSTGGLSYSSPKGIFGNVSYRFLGDRAANEDASIIADGYVILDGVVGYRNEHFEFSLTAENLLNTDWKEAQFATLSRLDFEETPVEEIHFTPGTPFFLNAKIGFRF
jgi:outer membrane receptor protein involved in Fe transport